jgi:class 3 adenylate cyclase
MRFIFIRIRSLQQRLILFLLVPVSVLLLGMGFVGFLYARNTMLDQWQEAAVLKLERAAHHIDMRLDRPIQWIQLFHQTGGGMGMGYSAQQFIFNQLQDLEGVVRVDLNWADRQGEHPEIGTTHQRMGRGYAMADRMGRRDRDEMMRFHRGKIAEVTSPRYDALAGGETVGLISSLKDDSDQVLGTLEVTIRFDYLMQDIQSLGWWQSELAYLVDDAGRLITGTQREEKDRKRLGETGDALEISLLEAMHRESFGTLRGPGHPPEEVAGFYRMKNAPWTVVLVAPGQKVFAPIVRFRTYYFLAGGLCVLVILLLIRSVVGRMARSVKRLSEEAEKVAQGDYGDSLPQAGQDEIGQLTDSFNAMMEGLKERDFIRNTFGRYVDEEVAAKLMKRPEAARLGGEKRHVAILMSDLRNFTPLAETLSPDDTIRILNHYFSHMIEIIRKHRGIIVDFFGDALLVFFDPMDELLAPCVRRSVTCAFDMQKDIETFNRESEERGGPQLEMGIGVNAGEVVVGNIGSASRAKYGIVGTPVNLTQRIQALADVGEVVISDAVYPHVRNEVTLLRSIDTHLKGIRHPVTLYVVGDANRRMEE